MKNTDSDCYRRLQRLALLPTEVPLPIGELRSAVKRLSGTEQQQLLTVILSQGLHFFWLIALRALPDLSFSDLSRETLKEQCFTCKFRYRAQKSALIELDDLFEKDHIPYAIFKGAHIREAIYDSPAFRSSADIDLLVAPNEKFRAIRTLCTNGYILLTSVANVSHEVSLFKNNVHLDLHWHIMRPGRTRIDLTDLFLQSRQRCGFFWALDNDMTLLVLLTHPVFTEYSAGPQSSIVKLADLRRWLTKKEIDWQRLLHLLESSGMKTAAWITATILADITGCRLPAFVFEELKPKNPKRFLLQQWLNYNLSSRFADYPIFPKYIFTLLAHDNLNDIFRFIRTLRAEQRINDVTLKELQQASEYKKPFQAIVQGKN